MDIRDLNLIDFAQAYALQESLVQQVLTGLGPETLLLMEHPAVYTIGRGGNEKNILDPFIEWIRINRGGDVTFHGPGQLIGYPIINLANRGRDLHRFMHTLEEGLILTAADFGVKAYRVTGLTGVWTEQGKLASIGVGIRRWITMHGFALNVLTSSLAGFERINPCGIKNCSVTSLEDESVRTISMKEVKARLLANLCFLLLERLPRSDFVH